MGLRPRARLRRHRVYLHIGAMKTGTTFLQSLMTESHAELAAAGILFPIDENGRWALQAGAIHDRAGPALVPVSKQVQGSWDRMVRLIRAHPGPSVVSMELLSFLQPSDARRIVSGLAPADVHVVLTVRDLRRVVPGVWQTAARNGGIQPWPGFVRSLTQEPGDDPGREVVAARRHFRRTQDIARMLRTWGSIVGPGRLHVVTVPPPGADPLELWSRFASVVGVDPAVVAGPPKHSGAALGYPSAELARRVNLSLGDRRSWRLNYRDAAKRVLATAVLTQRRSRERAVAADRLVAQFGAQRNARVREAVDAWCTRRSGTLTGDLADLPTVADHELEYAELALPPEADVLAAAAFALPRMRAKVERMASAGADDASVRAFLERIPAARRYDPRPDWAGRADPVAAAVDDLAASVRALTAARRAAGATSF